MIAPVSKVKIYLFTMVSEVPILPYEIVLFEYYCVIRDFVQIAVEHIEWDEYSTFERAIQSKYTGAWFDSSVNQKSRAIYLLTTFIHQTSIIHSADHYTFWTMINMGNFIPRVSATMSAMDVEQHNTQYDVVRLRNANNLFSYTHSNETFGNLLQDTVYDSEILDNYGLRQRLETVEQSLRERGLNVCPLSIIYASTCG